MCGVLRCCVALLSRRTQHRGIDEAREAGVILKTAKERLDSSDKVLKVSVDGIWNTVMAIKGICQFHPSFDVAHLRQSKMKKEMGIRVR